MQRGEVRWARLGPIVGHEQDGHRPVLIVSDTRYAVARRLVVVIPLTHSERLKFPLAVELSSLEQVSAGVVRRSFALPGQIRTLAVQRLGASLGQVEGGEIDLCLTAFLQICGRIPPRRADNDG